MDIAILIAEIVAGLMRVVGQAIASDDQETLDKVRDILPAELHTTLAKAEALARAAQKLGLRP